MTRPAPRSTLFTYTTLFRSDQVVALAKRNGAAADPVIRQRIARSHTELKIMRYNAMRMLSGQSGSDGALQKEALIYKLYWATWPRERSICSAHMP